MPKTAIIPPAIGKPVSDPLRSAITEGREIHKKVSLPAVTRHFKSKKNYYAFLLGSIPLIKDPTVDTMCVGISNGGYVLRYHPTWYQYLTREEVCGVIEHEALHIALGHIPRLFKFYLRMVSDQQKEDALQLSNYAADFAANYLIRSNKNKLSILPKGALQAEDFELPTGKSYEWYLTELMKRKNDARKNQDEEAEKDRDAGEEGEGGEGTTGDKPSDNGGSPGGDGRSDPSISSIKKLLAGLTPGHGWDPTDSEESKEVASKDSDEMYKELAEKAGLSPSEVRNKLAELADALEASTDSLIKESARDFQTVHPNSRGNIPHQFLDRIDLSDPKNAHLTSPIGRKLVSLIRGAINSKSDYRINVLNLSALSLGSTIGLYGAYEDEDSFYIEFCIDTSGSMSQDDIAKCLMSLNSLMQAYPHLKVRVVDFDCEIHRRYYLTPKDKVDDTVVGRGGTNFNPIFKEIYEGVTPEGERLQKPDLIVIATDGEAPPPHEDYRLSENKHPVAWLITCGRYHRNEAPCKDFGKEILV